MTLIIPYAFYRNNRFLEKLPDVIRSFRSEVDKPAWRYEFSRRVTLLVLRVDFTDEDYNSVTGWKLAEEDELGAG